MAPISSRPLCCDGPNSSPTVQKCRQDKHLGQAHVSPSGRITCDECGRSSSRRDILTHHFRARHPEILGVPKFRKTYRHYYFCDDCPAFATFQTGEHSGFVIHWLRRHSDFVVPTKQETKSKRTCDVCGYSASVAVNNFGKHVSRHSLIPQLALKLNCEDCGKSTGSVTSMMRHWEVVHWKTRTSLRSSNQARKVVICDTCGKSLILRNLPQHLAVHHGYPIWQPYEKTTMTCDGCSARIVSCGHSDFCRHLERCKKK